MKSFLITLFVLTVWALPQSSRACTSFIITKGASVDKSTIITYAADSHELYGELYYRPAAKHAPGTMMEVKEWDTGKVLGKIKQVPQTYAVVGNMNEHQLAISETTYGGRKELKNDKAVLDYGSLIYITLQRAKTAREAIKIMTDLVAEYGYYSSGETFSIADPNEAWIMDLIGKGPDEKGAVWVARRVPDGYVTGHANQARIRKFPLKDPENCVYAPDVISFARKKKYFEGKDEDFSFTDAYAPTNCRDLRIRDGRVWAMYHRVAPSLKISADYVMCKHGAQPIPLWVKPDKKLSVADVAALMRDHFEDTPMDMAKDPGAGPYRLPYRWRPLTWKYKGKNYLHERATATQQTGFSFVSQSRANLPGHIGGVLWFSVDDAASTVYVPMYAGILKAPRNYAVGTGSFTEFTWDSAFWTFNWVSNFAYSRYSDMIKDIRLVQSTLEKGFFDKQADFEKKALEAHKKSPAAAQKLLTEYSETAATTTVKRWQKLGQELLMKYLDGNVRNAKGKVTHPPYPDETYKSIVDATGSHLELPADDKPLTDAQRLALKPAPKKVDAAPKSSPDKKSGKVAPDTKQKTVCKKEAPCPKCDKKTRGCSCSSVADSSSSNIPVFLFFALALLPIFYRRRR
ncbi:C69 family dipeptidase [Myxococcota bacterium]|nr:C69 family dipeptidase [Myxococcota bacterium]MBU1380972.1 C69 family dipeptidase [Myxococcota bacterium]MBU1498829.1 C69 family dipeptidase [Myxococcota bacterium]